MADFRDPNAMSFEELRALTRNPQFRHLPPEYKQRVYEELERIPQVERAPAFRPEVAQQQEAERQERRILREGAPVATGVVPPAPAPPAPQPTPSPLEILSADTVQPPGGSATPGDRTQPDLGRSNIDRLLSGGAGSPLRFTPFKPPEPLNEGEIRERMLKGMPEERKAEETYKADPYMTMLQTGLRILAAKPELGRSGLNVISEPLAKGVEQYRGEKEKERASKREEAKEARTEAYRRYESQRGVESKLLELGQAERQRNVAEQQLRFLIEKGGSEEGREAAKLALARAELELKREVERTQMRPGQAYQIVVDLERERGELERIPENQRTPEQRSRLESIPILRAAAQRAGGAYIGAEGRQSVAGEAQRIEETRRLNEIIANPLTDPAVREVARRDLLALRGALPQALPPAPR
jgi:hypothetical protein